MKELLDRILDLPKTQKIAVLAALVLALFVLDYYLLYSPGSAEISRLSQENENNRNERDKKRRGVADLPKFREEKRELDARRKEALAQLPDRKEIPDLLTNISNKVREAGLEILIFRPRAENYQDFYAEIPIDIVVRGGFHNVVTFFDEVGRLNRLVNINNIEFKNPKPGEDRMTLEAAALTTAFRFVDDAERAKIAAERAKEKKK